MLEPSIVHIPNYPRSGVPVYVSIQNQNGITEARAHQHSLLRLLKTRVVP